jgi:hypothetical protein
MKELGVLSHPDYKVTAMVDHLAMITVQSESHGVFDCKPLGVMWGKCPEVRTCEYIFLRCCFSCTFLVVAVSDSPPDEVARFGGLFFFCIFKTPRTQLCLMI